MNTTTEMGRGRIAALFGISATLSLALLAGCDQGAADGDGVDTRPAARQTTSANPPKEIVYTGPETRSSASENPPDWPPIEFSPATMNFGVVSPGDSVTGKVTIYNAGTRSLRILRSGTSCGCTTAEDLSGRILMPGGSTEVTMAMKPKSGLGEKRESLTMFFEGYEQTPVRYYVVAEVSLPIRVTPSPLDIRESLSGTITVESREDKPFRVVATNGEEPNFVGFDPRTDEPRTRYEIAYDMSDRERRRDIPWYYVVETDHPDAPIIDMRIYHDQTRIPQYQGRPWVLKDHRVVLDVVRPGETVEVAASIEYSSRVTPAVDTTQIRVVTPELFDAELFDVEQDGQILTYRIRVTPKQTEPGLLYGRMEVIASGFPMPVHVIGRIQP